MKKLVVLIIMTFAVGGLADLRLCPPVPKDLASCPENLINECSSHANCAGDKLCCTDGCKRLCTKPVFHRQCSRSVDFAILVDSSGSVSRRNFARLKDFLKNLVSTLQISEDGWHVGIIAYSTRPEVVLRFNELSGAELNLGRIQEKIENMPHQRGLTFIDRALASADRFLFTVEAGMRPRADKVMLVVTDGRQTTDAGPYTPLRTASQPLKDKNVAIYALGVGFQVEISELLAVASSEDFVYQVGFSDFRLFIPAANLGGVYREKVDCEQDLKRDGLSIGEKSEVAQLVLYGESTTLSCQITHHVPVYTTWLTNGLSVIQSQVKTNSSGNQTISSLTLSRVNCDHMGLYACAGSREPSFREFRSKVFNVSVFLGLKVTGKSYIQKQVWSGGNLKLRCRLESSTPVTVTWLKDGKPIRKDRVEPPRYSADRRKVTSVVNIRRIGCGDKGLYACVVENCHHGVVKQFKLKVRDREFMNLC